MSEVGGIVAVVSDCECRWAWNPWRHFLCEGVDGRYYGSVGVSLWSIVGCRDSGCRGCTRVSVFL